MKFSRECIACLAKQVVKIAEDATDDVSLQDEIIKTLKKFE